MPRELEARFISKEDFYFAIRSTDRNCQLWAIKGAHNAASRHSAACPNVAATHRGPGVRPDSLPSVSNRSYLSIYVYLTATMAGKRHKKGNVWPYRQTCQNTSLRCPPAIPQPQTTPHHSASYGECKQFPTLTMGDLTCH